MGLPDRLLKKETSDAGVVTEKGNFYILMLSMDK